MKDYAKLKTFILRNLEFLILMTNKKEQRFKMSYEGKDSKIKAFFIIV